MVAKICCKVSGESVPKESKSYTTQICHYVEMIACVEFRLVPLGTDTIPHFQGLPNYTFNNNILRKVLLLHSGGEVFILHEQDIQLTLSNVSLILCILDNSTPIYLHSRLRKLSLNKFFSSGLHMDENLKTLTTLVKSDNLYGVQSTMSLGIVFICVCFFIPQSNCSCSRNVLYYLQDVESMRIYNWANCVHNVLLKKSGTFVVQIKDWVCCSYTYK